VRDVRRQALTIASLIGAAVLVVDLVSKRWAAAHFAGRLVEVVPGLLWFEYAENPGAAFSLFRNAGPFLGLAAAVAVGVVGHALLSAKSRTEVTAFGLILGGAVGNLADRIFRGDGFLDGKVIDWIRLSPIPTFNVADSAVTVAVTLLLARSLFGHDR
jgi:signal peptidase II